MFFVFTILLFIKIFIGISEAPIKFQSIEWHGNVRLPCFQWGSRVWVSRFRNNGHRYDNLEYL